MAAVHNMPHSHLYKLQSDTPSAIDRLKPSALTYSDGATPELLARMKRLAPTKGVVHSDRSQGARERRVSPAADDTLRNPVDEHTRPTSSGHNSSATKVEDKEIQLALHRCSNRGWTVIDEYGNKVAGSALASATTSSRPTHSNGISAVGAEAPRQSRSRTAHAEPEGPFAAGRRTASRESSNAASTTLVNPSSRSSAPADKIAESRLKPIDVSNHVSDWVQQQRKVTADAFSELHVEYQVPSTPVQTANGSSEESQLYVAESDLADVTRHVMRESRRSMLTGHLGSDGHVYHASPAMSTIMRHIAKMEAKSANSSEARACSAEQGTRIRHKSAPTLAVFVEYKRVGKQLGELLRLSILARDAAGDVRSLVDQFFKLDVSPRKDDSWQKRSKIRERAKNKLEEVEKLLLQIYPIIEEFKETVQSAQCAEPGAVLEMINIVLEWFTIDHVLNNYSSRRPVRPASHMSRRRSQDASDAVARIWQAIRREREVQDVGEARRRSLQGVQAEDLVGSIGRRLERQFGRIYHVAVEAIRCALKVSVGFDDVIFPIQGILKVDSMLESAVYHIPTLSIFGGHGEIENIAKDDGAQNCDFLGTTYISVDRAMEVYAQAIRADAAVWDENDKRTLSLIDAKPGDNRQLENFSAMRLVIAQRKQAFDQWQSAILGRTSIVVCGTV